MEGPVPCCAQSSPKTSSYRAPKANCTRSSGPTHEQSQHPEVDHHLLRPRGSARRTCWPSDLPPSRYVKQSTKTQNCRERLLRCMYTLPPFPGMYISGLETEPIIIRASNTYQPSAVRTSTATDDTLAIIRSNYRNGPRPSTRIRRMETSHKPSRHYFVPMGVVPSLAACTKRSIPTSKSLDRQCSFVP